MICYLLLLLETQPLQWKRYRFLMKLIYKYLENSYQNSITKNTTASGKYFFCNPKLFDFELEGDVIYGENNRFVGSIDNLILF